MSLTRMGRLRFDGIFSIRLATLFSVGIAATATLALLLATASAVAQERHYELVSPADDRFYNAVFRAADPDLSGVYYQVGGSSGAPEPAWHDGAVPDAFGATRTAQGWETSWLTPYCPHKFSVYDEGDCTDTSEAPGPEWWVSAGDGKIIFATQAPIAPGKPGWDVSPLAPWPTNEIYAGNAQTTSQLGWETLPSPDGWGSGIDVDEWMAASADQSTVVFVSEDVRLAEAASLPAGPHLYVNRNGTLDLVSAPVDGASGGECASPCEVRTLSGNPVSASWRSPQITHVVSNDGQRVFFSTNRRLHPDATAGRNEVYVRDGEQLRLLSDGLVDRTGIGNDATFQWAAADGSRAFIEVNGRLWAVDVPSETSTSLTPDGVNASFVWASEDGSTALMRSDSEFGGAPALTGQKLYIWRAGEGTSFVAPIHNTDSLMNAQAAVRDVHATTDGSTIVFSTRAAIDPADTNGATDLYRLRGAALEWLTPRSGPAATGDIAMTYDVGVRGIGSDFNLQIPRALLADRETVLFTTTATLVPEDTDAGKEDVYSVRDGHYTLISPPGGVQEDAWLNDASPDGSVVLFTTREALVEGDTDEGMADIYSARIDGGFPESPDQSPCTDDDCQGPSPAPAPPLIGSAAASGEGNLPFVVNRDRASVAVKRFQSVRGPVARLRIRVPNVGRILVRGPRVRRSTGYAPKAGIYRMRVALRPAAKRALRKRKRLPARVRVLFRTNNGQMVARIVRLTFRQAR